MRWLERYNLPPDIRAEATRELRALWAYDSMGIEGNQLDYADTRTILEEGITIGGRPLREHNEIVGHAAVTDRLDDLSMRDLRIQDVKDLHRAVMVTPTEDILCPHGDWKREPNYSWTGEPSAGGRQFCYSDPDDVPALMEHWVDAVNHAGGDASLHRWAALHGAFIAVHPFYDGNGRMGRLLASLPRLRSGEPPLIVPRVMHKAYLAAAERDRGGVIPTRATGLWPPEWRTDAMVAVLSMGNQGMQTILDAARTRAEERARRAAPSASRPRPRGDAPER